MNPWKNIIIGIIVASIGVAIAIISAVSAGV
jgi:hypothetical protein